MNLPWMVQAQGTSPMDMMENYEDKTGDDHYPALLGKDEIVLNKEVAKRYPELASLNDMFPNNDAAGMPTSMGGIPSYQLGTSPGASDYYAGTHT